MERSLQERRILPDQQCFYLEKLVQIEWSISKKKTTEEPMKQNFDNIILITVLNLKQLQSLDLSEYLLIYCPSLKDFLFSLIRNQTNQ